MIEFVSIPVGIKKPKSVNGFSIFGVAGAFPSLPSFPFFSFPCAALARRADLQRLQGPVQRHRGRGGPTGAQGGSTEPLTPSPPLRTR